MIVLMYCRSFLERNFKKSIRAKIDAATEVVKSVDDHYKKTVKRELRLSFETYDTKVKELLELKV